MKYLVSYNDSNKTGKYTMDHSLELSNLIEVKAVLKEWKKQNPDLYQYAVCKETKRAITQIFGVL